jgi:hypothetical protein
MNTVVLEIVLVLAALGSFWLLDRYAVGCDNV